MTTAQVVVTSVIVKNNSPVQGYVHLTQTIIQTYLRNVLNISTFVLNTLTLNKSKYLLIRRQKTKSGRGKLYANRTIYGSSVAVIYIRRSYEGKG